VLSVIWEPQPPGNLNLLETSRPVQGLLYLCFCWVLKAVKYLCPARGSNRRSRCSICLLLRKILARIYFLAVVVVVSIYICRFVDHSKYHISEHNLSFKILNTKKISILCSKVIRQYDIATFCYI